MIVDYAKIMSGIGVVVAHLFDLFGKPDSFSVSWIEEGVEMLAVYGEVDVFLSFDVKRGERDVLIVGVFEEKQYIGVDYKDGVVVLEDEENNRIKYDIKQRKVVN